LKIRLESARHEPVRWQEVLSFAPDELGLGGEVELTPVDVRGSLSFDAPNFLIDASLTFTVQVPCDRCTAPVRQEIDGRLTALVHQASGRREPGGGERELKEDELGVLEVAGDVLDTRPLVAEQVLLELPTRPLCREDCAGLCPTCGADRNLGPCGCRTEPVDPRWAALAALRDRQDDRA
jgi:uncharacterized protein